MKNAIDSLPASWYTDPAIYQAERENIFARQWLYAAHECQMPIVGDYVKVELAGYSLMLIRKSENEITGFHNVCRHRAAPLLTDAQGSLSGSTLTCRYHGWSYNTDGQLAAAPYFDCSSSCDKEKFSLYPINVATFDGLIFINMSDERNCEPFAEAHSELLETIRNSHCNLSDYTFHSTRTRVGRFNWKIWIEGYQECYHCPTVHPIFQRDFALQKYKIENRTLFSEHSCERRGESESGTFQGLWLWIYPNLGMPFYEPSFYTLQAVPVSVNETRLSYTFHFREPENEKMIREYFEFFEQVTQEDIDICEAVQRNLEVGVFKQGFLNPVRENGVAYFHSLIREALLGTDCGGVTERELTLVK